MATRISCFAGTYWDMAVTRAGFVGLFLTGLAGGDGPTVTSQPEGAAAGPTPPVFSQPGPGGVSEGVATIP